MSQDMERVWSPHEQRFIETATIIWRDEPPSNIKMFDAYLRIQGVKLSDEQRAVAKVVLDAIFSNGKQSFFIGRATGKTFLLKHLEDFLKQ